MSIDIVTHCWSGDDVPIYHHLLRMQISSLILNPPKTKTTYIVFMTESDNRTVDVIADMFGTMTRCSSVKWRPAAIPAENLFRRSIMRHSAAEKSTSDVVWFTDVDYLFGEGVVDAAERECLASEHPLVFPETVWTNRVHQDGDKLIEQTKQCRGLRVVDETQFIPTSYKMAIGGIQIAKGDFCRENGYCNRRIGLKPVDSKDGFRKCRGDSSFRRLAGTSEPRCIERAYRIRHSRCGRDKGTVDHSC